MNDETINKLQGEINANAADIRAEVQVLLALERGMPADQFITNSNGGFRREYSRDINKAEIKEDANNQAFLEIYLSRSGVYDQLPEGLFFQGAGKRRASVADLSADYKSNRKKEAGIRKFFQPVEHEFFLKKLDIEEDENLLLEGLQSGVLNEYFIEFWQLPSSVPRNLLASLILLLPYAYKIAGNTRLMAESLGYILKEPVRIETESLFYKPHASVIAGPSLGEAVLGLDFVAGNTFFEDIVSFRIEIGPLERSLITDYVEGAARYDLLRTFERFFIPAGADMVTEVAIDPSKRNMMLSPGAGPVLGFSSYL